MFRAGAEQGQVRAGARRLQLGRRQDHRQVGHEPVQIGERARRACFGRALLQLVGCQAAGGALLGE